MRILCTCRPLAGHVEPLVPLAEAAARRGHDVIFATGEPADERLRERGFACLTAGGGSKTRVAFAPRIAELAGAAPDERRAAFFAELFVGIELEPRLRDLRAILRERPVDVVLHEAAEMAGPLAAALAGVPWVTAGYGARIPAAVLDAAGAAAAPHWRACGLEPEPRAGIGRHLYLDPFPPSLEAPGEPLGDELRVRLTPAPLPPSADAPAWLREAAGTPLVYVTFGTVWNLDPDRFAAVLAAVAEVAGAVVATTGPALDGAALGPQPPHVHVHRFIPQAQLLPFSAAVVSHGGSGTVLGAAAHALPQVLLPQAADQFTNAGLLAAAGAGRMLAGARIDGAAVRDAVAEALGGGPLREAARRLRDELDAMPAPAVAIERLERLAG